MSNQPTTDYPLFSFSGEEASRRPRLERVWQDVITQAHHYGNTRLPEWVAELRDHKGILEVHWLEKPAVGEKDFFTKAWANQSEPASCVKHYLPS